MSEPALDQIVEEFHRLYYTSADRTWRDTRWRGVPVQKCPFDLWVYQELLWEVQPDVLIETGTYLGGSAYFCASLFDLLGRGRVLSIDVEERPGRAEHPRITYLQGSSTSPEILQRVAGALLPGDKVMVLLDSDHTAPHVAAELEAYGALVTPGSYVIVEDSNINGHPVLQEFGPGPTEAVEAFLARRSEEFEVDRRREKFLLTFNPGGYLRRRRAGETASEDPRARWQTGYERERTLATQHPQHQLADLHREIAKLSETVGWLHAEVAKRDEQIRWLHEEVAKRDEEIRWLHAEVAQRDGEIARLRESR